MTSLQLLLKLFQHTQQKVKFIVCSRTCATKVKRQTCDGMSNRDYADLFFRSSLAFWVAVSRRIQVPSTFLLPHSHRQTCDGPSNKDNANTFFFLAYWIAISRRIQDSSTFLQPSFCSETTVCSTRCSQPIPFSEHGILCNRRSKRLAGKSKVTFHDCLWFRRLFMDTRDAWYVHVPLKK